jgi:hypothetical protein
MNLQFVVTIVTIYVVTRLSPYFSIARLWLQGYAPQRSIAPAIDATYHYHYHHHTHLHSSNSQVTPAMPNVIWKRTLSLSLADMSLDSCYWIDPMCGLSHVMRVLGACADWSFVYHLRMNNPANTRSQPPLLFHRPQPCSLTRPRLLEGVSLVLFRSSSSCQVS